MLQQLLAPPLPSSLDTGAEAFARNRADMLEHLEVIDELLDEAEAGGGPEAMDRMRSRDKMPIRERIGHVLDPDSPFLEISPLAGYDSSYTVGGGFVVGIGVIAGVECVIVGNDPTVLGGAMTPYMAKKWMRALEIARHNRMPYVSFVESAGADLRVQTGDGGGTRRRARTEHFAETGRFFYEMIELSKLGIPTVCVVFGSSTAGGAYQPGMSDYNIFIKEQSKVFLAGPPLVKMATGEDSDDESLGGGELHADKSGLADYLAEDEMDALRMCREVVSHLDWHKAGPEPSYVADEPVHDPEGLMGLVSRDLRQPVDVKEIIGRVVDGSGAEVGSVAAVELVTVGQRRGMALAGGVAPRFAVDVDVAGATVTVGSIDDLMVDATPLEAFSWADGPVVGRVLVQTSAHGSCDPAVLDDCVVLWAEPRPRVAPGQSVVFYDGDQVLGGSIARRA